MFNFEGDKFWTLHLGGEANYSLMCLTALKNNDCLVAGARYDWRNNPELERYIILYKIRSEGIIVNTPEISEPEFKLFPNPASNYIKIQTDDYLCHDFSKIKINIYDVIGTLQYVSEGIDLNDIFIDVSGLKPGFYILTIKNGSETILNKTIIII